jgi:hypothetical protein
MLFGPFDASGNHGDWKTGLEDECGVFDHGEVDVGDLVDVHMKVAFKNDLTTTCQDVLDTPGMIILPDTLLDDFSPCFQVRFTSTVFISESRKPIDVLLRRSQPSMRVCQIL